MVAGRSMDWGFSFEDVLFVNPPGEEMDGNAGDLSVSWTSKYGSVTSSIIGFFSGMGDAAKDFEVPEGGCAGLEFSKDGGSDGMNTEGLTIHMLYLGEEDGTVYAEPSETDPINISFMRYTRYVLDNFATVADAIEGLKGLRAIRDAICKDVPITDGQGHVLGAHMALEDATGDSAVIEHVNGTWQFYHSKTDALVMTNEPPYDKQKEILAQYEPWGGDITLPDNLPGSVNSAERMVRLEYYLQYTPEPKSYPEAIANVRSLISTTNVPFGAPYGGGVYPTWWTSFSDVTDKVYFFDWHYTPNMIWIDLNAIPWESVPGTLKLLPQDVTLEGNALCDFVTLDDANPNLEGCETTAKSSSGAKGLAFGAAMAAIATMFQL
ncbi:hypothetical protein THAOC_32445 [Thalassiosira oceanica]|uniref:Choloylglycine hydrolase/NAAA C-terminal domain-containing protein n=1 Tax=Thalassiosira oceanica TaxID=159749 RepID=K0R793_THAOC|nr:hypothetical protein THAOC_32445 [Thalassiosira oceanica]|eukprot:EJK48735.1 hypothetical protein THAOC_32445 [Thalassiosira oceanica]